MLKAIFNSEDGISEDAAIRLYQRAAKSSRPGVDVLKRELEFAFSDESLSWRQMLLNEDYEVFDASSEDEAREYARRILWTPLLDTSND
jgi:hypothetical protein